VIEDFDFCDSVINGVEINATLKNTEIIHGDLELSVANDNANTAAIISNDNNNTARIIANDDANTAAIIANDNANKDELRDLILRTQIEADLAQEGAVPVAAFLTPEANGGYLNLTRALVVQAIANIRGAGGTTGHADSFLSQGDAAKAAGQFKTAYFNYRKAYKAAVN
jgi:predicted metal-dependent phosphoesterase TrpH